jgi:hypothetical protein
MSCIKLTSKLSSSSKFCVSFRVPNFVKYIHYFLDEKCGRTEMFIHVLQESDTK